ncbi:hypothetical protein GMSM_31900 [Geomonas sp. Red276]
MSRLEKLLRRLLGKPVDFTWTEATALLQQLGFTFIKGEGSRRKFYHEETKTLIILHEPHPGRTLKRYAVQELVSHLQEGGFIK